MTQIVTQRPKTIAEELNGQLVDGTKVDGTINYDPTTLIHTFKDGSQAKILTTFVDCESYMTPSTVSISRRRISKWMAI